MIALDILILGRATTYGAGHTVVEDLRATHEQIADQEHFDVALNESLDQGLSMPFLVCDALGAKPLKDLADNMLDSDHKAPIAVVGRRPDDAIDFVILEGAHLSYPDDVTQLSHAESLHLKEEAGRRGIVVNKLLLGQSEAEALQDSIRMMHQHIHPDTRPMLEAAEQAHRERAYLGPAPLIGDLTALRPNPSRDPIPLSESQPANPSPISISKRPGERKEPLPGFDTLSF